MVSYLPSGHDFLSDSGLFENAEERTYSSHRLRYDALVIPRAETGLLNTDALKRVYAAFKDIRKSYAHRVGAADGVLSSAFVSLPAPVWARLEVVLVPVRKYRTDRTQYDMVERGFAELAEDHATASRPFRALVPADAFCDGVDWEPFREIAEAAFSGVPSLDVRIVVPPGHDPDDGHRNDA